SATGICSSSTPPRASTPRTQQYATHRPCTIRPSKLSHPRNGEIELLRVQLDRRARDIDLRTSAGFTGGDGRTADRELRGVDDLSRIRRPRIYRLALEDCVNS